MKFPPLLLAAFFSLTSTGWATLVISFDPADLMVTSTGMDQVVDVGIVIDYVNDGNGTNTISGYELGFSEGSPSLTVMTGQTAGAPSSFTWSFGPSVNTTFITATNFSDNQIVDMTGTQVLGTLHFTLDAAFTSGVIPIALIVESAERNFGDEIPDSEIMVSGGDLVVSAAAVPEPASLAMMGLAACGAMGLRRRRKGAPSEQAV